MKIMMHKLYLGLMFKPPALLVQAVLSDYVRVSTDFRPYSFFANTKTTAFTVVNAFEKPMVTVRLNGYDGAKFYKKVSTLKKMHKIN